jgi:hypothetical protein
MPSLINAFLQTGRLILDIERRLAASPAACDEERRRLDGEHQTLVRRQQDEIVIALKGGVAMDLVEFALRLHGQYADREYPPAERCPAEELGDLLAEHGVRVVEALDAYRAALGRPPRGLAGALTVQGLRATAAQ